VILPAISVKVPRLPRLFFTETGLAGLRAMMAGCHLADPKKFAHIRRELGIDPVE
jgi:hypothetical protein